MRNVLISCNPSRVACSSPDAIWTLQPESCCILLICSPPRPITEEDTVERPCLGFSSHVREEKKKHLKCHHDYVVWRWRDCIFMYSLRPTMPSGTLYSSVTEEGLALQRTGGGGGSKKWVSQSKLWVPEMLFKEKKKKKQGGETVPLLRQGSQLGSNGWKGRIIF